MRRTTGKRALAFVARAQSLSLIILAADSLRAAHFTSEASMPKMTTAELKAMLAAEKADALSAMQASRLSDERTDAMDYYLGDMSRDMPAADGRSRAVS